jgi:hypothetical protein
MRAAKPRARRHPPRAAPPQAAAFHRAYGSRYERGPEDYSRRALLPEPQGLPSLARLPALTSLGLTGGARAARGPLAPPSGTADPLMFEPSIKQLFV